MQTPQRSLPKPYNEAFRARITGVGLVTLHPDVARSPIGRHAKTDPLTVPWLYGNDAHASKHEEPCILINFLQQGREQ